MPVISGFIKRLWGRFDYEKISFLPNGVFLVWFKFELILHQVLQTGYQLFDSKPMIVRPWSPSLELTKIAVKTVPAWIRLYKLDLKFWGDNCLAKIAGLVGNPVRADEATFLKTRLGYARYMVELSLGKEYPDSIQFLDEKDVEHTVRVEYEWKPTLCTKCKVYGHEVGNCRRGITKPPKAWRPMPPPSIPAAVYVQEDPPPTVLTVLEGPPVAPIQTTPMALDSVAEPLKSPLTGTSILNNAETSGPTLLTFLEVLSSSLQQSVAKLGPSPIAGYG
ncbi:hypothetical protein vseg_007470 [Gypsophila vaccaria]